ncbi:MAG: CDP-alcohol phosphatidyltransferase family protein [Thermodesulfobacteriota bacterium]|nr:CDP-alcohol phosphatidyltransferase family protein [Thermodesulfobacteriota bacterium]
MEWKTKPTDRFLLRFIKIYISAPISSLVVQHVPTMKPDFITLLASATGICGGIAFGMGLAWLGGLLAAIAQILDGVDGQVSRLTNKQSAEGAFLDSVLDRYMDFSLIFGILLYCLQFSALAPALLILVGFLATAGASQISYATARSASLHLNYSRPEYAGKGTRTTVIVACGLLAPIWIHFPFMALVYLAIHPNIAMISSLVRLKRGE